MYNCNKIQKKQPLISIMALQITVGELFILQQMLQENCLLY